MTELKTLKDLGRIARQEGQKAEREKCQENIKRNYVDKSLLTKPEEWIKKERVLEMIDKSEIISENSYGKDDGTDEILLTKYLIDKEELKKEIEKS